MGESLPFIIISASLGLFLIGALAALLWHKSATLGGWITYACALLANAGLVIGAICGFSRNSADVVTLIHGFFEFTDIVLRINAFSAFFLLVTGIVGFVVTIFAIGYIAEYREHKSVPLLNAGMLVFLLAIAGVVLAGNVFSFLVAWEIMSVVSYFLVIYEHEKTGAQKAGFIYVVMTHIGTIFLTFAFFIIQHYSGSFNFLQMEHTALPASIQTCVFLFAAIGFGTKAGLVPLHIWLPRAYSSAPSHITALMSGVMSKTAIFGFLLVTMQLLQTGPLWWGIAAVVVGGNTALFGVLHALGEIDQKRMLGYSSIENLGMMFMGIGAALIFQHEHQPLLASFALMAVLYHLFNHALFKSLLFMGSGAVLLSARTLNMNSLGGLIRRMPWTALFMLAGSLAIAALPPTNGFVNEWMLLQSMFALGASGSTFGMHLFGALMIALLALVGALAVFLFVRYFSMSFLALPRSEMAEHASEAPVSMRIGMGLLAGGCILLGVMPFVVFSPVQKAIQSLTGAFGDGSITRFRFTPAIISSGFGQVSSGAAGLMVVFGLLVAWVIARVIGGRTKTVCGETWVCGWPLYPRMGYTAGGFSKPVRMAFQRILKPSHSLIVDKNPRSPYFVRGYTYASRIPLIIENSLYKPAMKLIVAGATLFRKIQNGIVQSYLLYLFATLVFILIWVMRR